MDIGISLFTNQIHIFWWRARASRILGIFYPPSGFSANSRLAKTHIWIFIGYHVKRKNPDYYNQ